MCVNSSKGELGLGPESPEGHRSLHRKGGKVEGRRGHQGLGGCRRLEGHPGPVKGDTGRVPLGRRRDFLLFRSWHGKLILVLPGKHHAVDEKSRCAVMRAGPRKRSSPAFLDK